MSTTENKDGYFEAQLMERILSKKQCVIDILSQCSIENDENDGKLSKASGEFFVEELLTAVRDMNIDSITKYRLIHKLLLLSGIHVPNQPVKKLSLDPILEGHLSVKIRDILTQEKNRRIANSIAAFFDNKAKRDDVVSDVVTLKMAGVRPQIIAQKIAPKLLDNCSDKKYNKLTADILVNKILNI